MRDDELGGAEQRMGTLRRESVTVDTEEREGFKLCQLDYVRIPFWPLVGLSLTSPRPVVPVIVVFHVPH